LRFVKKTVNFDDPGTYHFYYGDESGTPGSILTFFPWGESVGRGRRGTGQATVVSFSVPPASLPFWQQRLSTLGLKAAGPKDRFGEPVLRIEDTDGMLVELIGADDSRPGYVSSELPSEVAIRGFHSVLLAEEGFEKTEALLTDPLGFREIGRDGDRIRYEVDPGGPGSYVDLECMPTAPRGVMGMGSVHHVAYRVADDSSQASLRAALLEAGANVTPVIDRQYFRSVYFREPGGVLFEIATDPPGFTVDEEASSLGTSLKLPPRYEEKRELLETVLHKVTIPSPRPSEQKA
jgi:catechol 2,3-dioxygenase-like lactoylglutathione lyase family enzyme